MRKQSALVVDDVRNVRCFDVVELKRKKIEEREPLAQIGLVDLSVSFTKKICENRCIICESF